MRTAKIGPDLRLDFKWNPFDPLVNKVLNFKQDDIHF